MKILVATHSMTFAGRTYAKGEELPLEAMPSQRHLETLVSTRRVRVELDEAEQVDAKGSMRCAHCGRGGFDSDVKLTLHLRFSHGVTGKRVAVSAKPVEAPAPVVAAKAKPTTRKAAKASRRAASAAA